MTASPAPISQPGPSYGIAPGKSESPRRGILAQALRDTFTRPGARFGATWISILVFLGVFAPFLANSHPILMRDAQGKLSSPMLQALAPSDVIIVAVFIAALTMALLRRWSLGVSFLIVVAVGAATAVPSFLFFKYPQAPVYQRFREMEQTGEIKWAMRTIIPYSANDRMRDRPQEILKPPSKAHWLGTSVTGEDVLSRMLHASRVALTIGLISTSLAVLIGCFVGGLMGFFAGLFDLFAMRFIEILEAVPRLILLLIVTVFFGRSIYLMMAVIGLISWTADARFIRAEFLRLRKLDFVHAATALGIPLRSIIFRHMLPNGIAPVLVNSSFGVAGAILLESVLSFLGLGLGAEDPSWGQLLNQARMGGTGFNWWIATFPGAAIFLTVFSYILIGESMRDALDPKLKKRD
jgi:peptide/nickel transport system permease protein